MSARTSPQPPPALSPLLPAFGKGRPLAARALGTLGTATGAVPARLAIPRALPPRPTVDLPPFDLRAAAQGVEDLLEDAAAPSALIPARALGLPGALKAAEQDRGQDRQHLLQDLGADPGEDCRLARNRAAHVLGAEQCLERLVALRHGSLGEGEGRVVEERGITARAHQPERARERVRLAGASLQAKREGGSSACIARST